MSLTEYMNLITAEPADRHLLIDELWRDFDIDFNTLSCDEIEQLRGLDDC